MESILKKIEQIIDIQMKGKFGLTDEESVKVANVVNEYWKELIFGNKFGNQIQTAFNTFKEKSATIQSVDLADELIKKAGISEEKAKMIKEFSVKDMKEQIKSEFLKEDGKPNWDKISGEAKELFGKIRGK
jgi:hypothetical protein